MEEVTIVGAGPAGATLAALLAARGVEVALYDRDSFPRDKLCGEFLSYDALPVLEAMGVELGDAPQIRRCRVVGSRATYEFEFPRPARGVSRMFFDDLLVRTAQKQGARLHIGDADLRGIVAGAWGRWGRFDQQLGRAFVRDRAHRNFGFKRHYRGLTADVIELHSFARGYLGVNAIEGGLTNICGLVHASRLAGHKGRWDAFVDTIRGEKQTLDELFARHQPVQEHYLSSEPVIFRAKSAVEGGIFMIGDASGIIDPLTGNGMAMAIQSALLLAPRIMRLVESPHRRAEIEDEYRRAHKSLFAPRIAWSRRVAALLSRPRLLDSLLPVAKSPKIGEFLLHRTRASHDDVRRLADAWFC